MAKRRSSIAGLGTPLADVGLDNTVDRRISVDNLGHSPLVETSENVLWNGQDAHRFSILTGEVKKGAIMNDEAHKSGIKRPAYSIGDGDKDMSASKGRLPAPQRLSSIGGRASWQEEDENYENKQHGKSNVRGRTSASRYSLMGNLDTYAEETDISAESASLNSSYNVPLVSSSGSHKQDTRNHATTVALKARRSSLMSLLSQDDANEADIDTNNPKNRLSIEEVLRSFRDDPDATENAIALVSATGRLLPSDFRKFVKAFKSPTSKAKKNSEPDSSLAKESIGVRAWQATGFEQSPEEPIRRQHSCSDKISNERQLHESRHAASSNSKSNQALVQSFHVKRVTVGRKTIDSPEIAHSAPEEDPEEGHWTAQELHRASAALRRVSFSANVLNASRSPVTKPLHDSSHAYSLSVPADISPLSPLAQLQAELEHLRSAIASQAAKYDNALQEKEKQTQELSLKLENYRYENTQKRSAARAVQHLKIIEEERLSYELSLARRSINRLGACKYRLLERREARLARLQDIDEMSESMCAHEQRRDSGAYERVMEPFYMELPSPGRNKFSSLPPPRNPDLFASSAFVKPLPARPQPAYFHSSASTAAGGAVNEDYYDGGADDFDMYGNYELPAAKPRAGAKQSSKLRHGVTAPPPRKPIVQRIPKPVFKASPSTRFGAAGSLNFIPLDEQLNGADSAEMAIDTTPDIDYQDLVDLDEEYRREKRLAAALKREEARRQRGIVSLEEEEEGDTEEDLEINEDYRHRRLNTFKSATEKRKRGRPRGTLKASKASAMRHISAQSKAKVPGRKRGRPPKKQMSELQESEDDEAAAGQSQDEIESENEVKAAFQVRKAPEKRKVGRPKGSKKTGNDTMRFIPTGVLRKQRETKAEKQLAALRAGEIILSEREEKRLERKIKKHKIALATALAGIPKKKRAKSSYALFVRDNRSLVLEALPEKALPHEVLTLLAQKWKECSAEEKEQWQLKADEENREQQQEADAEGLESGAESEGGQADAEAPQSSPEEADGEMIQQEAVPEKKKRGRPRKVVSELAEEQEPIAKKPKHVVALETESSAAELLGALTADSVIVGDMPASATDIAPAPEKKKRGRPKKIVMSEKGSVISEAQEAETAESIVGDLPVSVANGAPAPEKKKRGRPKKMQSTESSENAATDSLTASAESATSAPEVDAPEPESVSDRVMVLATEVSVNDVADTFFAEKQTSNELIMAEIETSVAETPRQVLAVLSPIQGAIKKPRSNKKTKGQTTENSISENTTSSRLSINIGRKSGMGKIPTGVVAELENQHTYFSSNENSMNMSTMSLEF